MINKMSSQELNQIFEDAKKKQDEALILIQNMKNDINKKLMIKNYADEFIDQKLDSINAGVVSNQNIVNFTSNELAGIYNKYGCMVHPRFKNDPVDIFNLKVASGTISNIMFKQSMTCKVNDIENEEYINLLKSDSLIDKEIVFDELNTDTITISYELDNSLALGTSRFNVIEIDPYIKGAYSLTSLECYALDTTGNLSSTPITTVQGFDNIGKTRIILNKKVKFSKVVMTFKINFSTEVNNISVYPFGLKHIYFMEADFLADTSFVIVPIIADDFIEYVYNDIVLYTANGKFKTTCDMYDIELYTNYSNNTLTGRVYTSSEASINRISKNTNKLYAKIPLVKKNVANDDKEYLSLNGIEFNFIVNEEIIL